MFVKERFVLNDRTAGMLRDMTPRFGYDGFGEAVYYRTYSRVMPNGDQEHWADTIKRVVEGTFSIRKDWYLRNHIPWQESRWQAVAHDFAIFAFQMKWLPPGRGLWAMGSDFIYERGAMALYNCAFTTIGKDIADDIAWLMDSLMLGVGVGFEPVRDNSLRIHIPRGQYDFEIPDSREGWTESVARAINAYMIPDSQKPRFIYDKLRPKGTPIKGFGGVASGPAPLQWFHEFITQCFERLGEPCYDSVRLKADLANGAGCCVVAGNVRRSAELMSGDIKDPTFLDLKNYDRFPERAEIGWMSNNSVILKDSGDFGMLGEIASRVVKNGEPGYINAKNLPYGRIGRMKNDKVRKDKARGFNPCGEIPLESREVCNVAETCPTVCRDAPEWYKACEMATLYMSTVSLLPTHQPSTNRVVARNRRIGCSIIDFTGWKHDVGVHKVIRFLREGYKVVRRVNKFLNAEAGVPPAIRITTIKPGGTVPKLPGKTPGAGHPTFVWTRRAMRAPKDSAFARKLIQHNVPHELDVYDVMQNTLVFYFPMKQGPAAPAEKVSLWEQAMNVVLLQREWADNAVANTLYFKPKWVLIEHWKPDLDDQGFPNEPFPLEGNLAEYIGLVTACNLIMDSREEYIVPERYKVHITYKEGLAVEAKLYEYNTGHEEDIVEPVLAMIAPLTKSVSVLPHSPKGVYRQMPEEGISEQEYHEMKAAILPIDWSNFRGSDGMDELFCNAEKCEVPQL